MNKIEKIFETFLWQSRLVVIVAVVISMLSALTMFYVASIDAYYMFSHLYEYASPNLDVAQRNAMRGKTVTHVVEIIDGFLLATVLMIFSMGLYELFISKIDVAMKDKETSSNVLLIDSLDDLKNRLAKVILMILIVRFFEFAISMKFKTPIDLLVFSGGIALIGLALYLSHAGEKQ